MGEPLVPDTIRVTIQDPNYAHRHRAVVPTDIARGMGLSPAVVSFTHVGFVLTILVSFASLAFSQETRETHGLPCITFKPKRNKQEATTISRRRAPGRIGLHLSSGQLACLDGVGHPLILDEALLHPWG
ncbi:hypothetical protein GQ53DRAFT_751358 [Thozetella sp. PMI_491]|nr:hypothetical protein GQ53DRAFT_751358 [Thozetella sp. PMI_491]